MTERTFTVLGRPWCHLCRELAEALRPLAQTFGWRVEEVDIDDFPDLVAQWDEEIPVLMHGDHYLFRHRLDEERVRVYCRAFR